MGENQEIPKGWKIVRIGDVFHFIGGGTPSKKNEHYWNGNISWASVKDVKGDYLHKTEDTITKEGLQNSSANLAYPDDVILITRILPGKTIISKITTAVNQDLKIVKPKFETSPEFIRHLFSFIERACIKLASGTTVLGISLNNLNEIFIPIPPLPEQHRIVAKIEELFSSLDKGIESLKTAQQHLKVYRQAVLKWAFEGKLTEEWRRQQKNIITAEILLNQIKNEKEREAKASGKKLKLLNPITDAERSELPNLPSFWSWVKLGDHAFVTKLAGFEFTKYVKYKHKGDIPVIRAQNVSKDSFIPRNFLYVNREIIEKLPRSRVYGGEILMVFVGAGLGNVGIVPEKEEYFLGPNVAKIALEKQFLNKYIFHFLSSKLGFANVTGMTKATAQGSISMANIREVSVPLISIEEQKGIVAEIEARLSVCDKIEESIEQSLIESESLRQSILKKAFEGKLVPQDPNDEPAAKLLERIKAEKVNNKLSKKGGTRKG